MKAIIEGEWKLFEAEKPETMLVSKPLYVVYDRRLYIGEYHSNECFYVFEGGVATSTLLGTVNPSQWPHANRLDVSKLYWAYVATANARVERLSDDEVLRTHNDREMILRTHLWSTLRLKMDPREPNDRKTGSIMSREPFTVYVDSQIPQADPEVIRYATVDALLADGWIVD